MKSHKKKSWTNVAKLFTATPQRFYQPESYDDIVTAVREAELMKGKIRAVGSGHTSTDMAISNDVLLDLSLLNAVSEAPKQTFKLHRRQEHIVRMDAGANIDTFNQRLDEMGYSFRSLGIIDHQTISGAVATGTHGCMRSLPGFPGLVKSMLLVAAEGRMHRIEPTDGITDPALHQEKNVQLIQDDDTFYAALVHFGAFGIIASYFIEVEPKYYLLEMRTIERWSDVRKQIENNTLYDDYPIRVENVFHRAPVHGLHIALNPHEVNGEHLCMVGRFFKLDKMPRRSCGDKLRSFLPTLVAATTLPFRFLVGLANNNPKKIPRLIHKSLQKMNDAAYINVSWKVWNQGMEYSVERTYGSEFAFNGTQSEWLKAVDEIFKRTRTLAANNLYAPNTLMLRYSRGTPAIICPDHGPEVVAWIGTPVPIKLERGKEVLDMLQDVCIAHGGKSHWGKMNNKVTPELVKKWYPKLEDWKKQMKKFNPNNTFSNAFTKRFELTT